MKWPIAVGVLLHCVAAWGSTIGTSFLIPLDQPRGHAFDAQRGLFYMTSFNSYEIARYDLQAGQFLAPMPLAEARQPTGMDITPDGRHLVVATSGPGSGVHMGKFDLDTGIDEGFSYSLAHGGGGYDIRMTSPDLALMTTLSSGYVQEVDLRIDRVWPRTDAPGTAPAGLQARSGIFPSGDEETMFIWEGDISSGPGFLYDRSTDTFGPSHRLNYGWHAGASVNRTGDLIATPQFNANLKIRDRDLNVVHNMGRALDGAQFDPVRDILYTFEINTDRIIAYDTNNWSQLFRFDIGEPIGDSRYFQEGHLSMSPDGNLLFLNTDSGVRVFSVPEPSTLALLLAATLLARRRRPCSG